MRLRIILFGLMVGVPCAAFAQQDTADQGAPRRVVTTTRLVAVFSELENQWSEAVQHKDGAAMNKLMFEDFQLWTPKTSGPLPREKWQQQAFERDLRSFHLRQMAVRSLNEETAVTSFVLSESVQSGVKSRTEDYFVVDIWAKNGDHWLCTDRYASPLSSVSGRTTSEDLKPSGKR
jgi:ketosteroid isomerase-like protein